MTSARVAPEGRPAGQRAASRTVARWPMPERSLLTTVLGLPPAAAVVLAAVFTVLGVLVDILRVGTLGGVFTVCYFTGCVLAVCWVRRRSLFEPMVAPPLLLAATVPAVVLLVAPPPGAGIAERLLVVGAPLVNAFPTMALTTFVVLAVGGARIVLQRVGPRVERGEIRRGSSAAHGAGRTSASPPRW